MIGDLPMTRRWIVEVEFAIATRRALSSEKRWMVKLTRCETSFPFLILPLLELDVD